MKFDLTVDRGPCDTDIRSWCLGIAIYSLIHIGLNVLFGPSVITLISFAIAIVGNICLLIGCIKYHHMLVGAWLIYALVEAISFPFAIIGTILHIWGYRESTGFRNVFMALIIHFIAFILLLFCARLVYSFYLQLKNRETSPQHAVVV